MSSLMQPIEVKYIGKREPWFDRLYDTGLSFVCGQKRVLPWDMAPKFLRHTDLFEQVEPAGNDDEGTDKLPDNKDPANKVDLKKKKAAESSKEDDKQPDVDEVPDDTQVLLDEQAAKNDAKKDEQLEKQALYDQVNNMDKDALSNFAEINYQQTINKRKSEDNLRADVIAMIDEFGAV